MLSRKGQTANWSDPVGARGSDVLTQFLVESTVMSVFGGLLEVGLGPGAAKLRSSS